MILFLCVKNNILTWDLSKNVHTWIFWLHVVEEDPPHIDDERLRVRANSLQKQFLKPKYSANVIEMTLNL